MLLIDIFIIITLDFILVGIGFILGILYQRANQKKDQERPNKTKTKKSTGLKVFKTNDLEIDQRKQQEKEEQKNQLPHPIK